MSLVYSYGSIYKSNLLFLSRGQVKSKYAGTGRQVVLKQPWRYVVWVQVPLLVFIYSPSSYKRSTCSQREETGMAWFEQAPRDFGDLHATIDTTFLVIN